MLKKLYNIKLINVAVGLQTEKTLLGQLSGAVLIQQEAIKSLRNQDYYKSELEDLREELNRTTDKLKQTKSELADLQSIVDHLDIKIQSMRY